MKPKETKVTWRKLFLIYILFSLVGVPAEGLYCLFVHGHWETHTVSLLGPFLIIYGAGAVIFYLCRNPVCDKNLLIQFLTYALAGSATELAAGLLLEFGLGMKAWDYSEQFMNFRGHISLLMTAVWGLSGISFSLIVPPIDALLDKISIRPVNILCAIFFVIMLFDTFFTAAAIVRWKQRHFNVPAGNALSSYFDKNYDDEFMQKRFCEWWFIK